MKRSILVAVFSLLSCDVAVATPQGSDTLVFGGRKYAIREIPMLGLWDYGAGSAGTGKETPPAFEARSSANWAGYRAQFEIRDSKLYLRRIVGWIDGKRRKDEEIIPGKRFPVVAAWYTGKIHLPIGDFNDQTQESTAVIIFEINKGEIQSVGFADRMKPIRTWNGLPRDTKTHDEDGAEQTDARGPE